MKKFMIVLALLFLCKNFLAYGLDYIIKETPVNDSDFHMKIFSEVDCDLFLMVEDWEWSPGWTLSCNTTPGFIFSGFEGDWRWFEVDGCGYSMKGEFKINGGTRKDIYICPGNSTLDCCANPPSEVCEECVITSTTTTIYVPPTTTTSVKPISSSTSSTTTTTLHTTTTILTTTIITTTIQPPPETFLISGHVEGDVASPVFIILSGTVSKTIDTNVDGYYEFIDLVLYFIITVTYSMTNHYTVIAGLSRSNPHYEIASLTLFTRNDIGIDKV
jgi:hypothetical protein